MSAVSVEPASTVAGGAEKDNWRNTILAGLANYMNVDPMIVRLVFVAGTIFGFGSFILIYLAIALLAD